MESSLLEKFQPTYDLISLVKIMSKMPSIHCLNTILQELSEEETKLLGKSISENLVTEGSKINDSTWITIQHPSVAQLVLASLGDEDKKNILNAVLDKARTFMEILEITGLPPSSAYRKICTLIDNGLLVDIDSGTSSDGKRKIRYKSIFKNIEINIEKNRIIIKILLTKESLEKSSKVPIIHC